MCPTERVRNRSANHHNRSASVWERPRDLEERWRTCGPSDRGGDSRWRQTGTDGVDPQTGAGTVDGDRGEQTVWTIGGAGTIDGDRWEPYMATDGDRQCGHSEGAGTVNADRRGQ